MKKILPILTLVLVILSLLILTSCGCIHHYSWIDKDPTCTEQGEHIEKCIRCGHVKNHYYTDAWGHDYGYVCSVEPTCAEPSYEKYTCSMCGDIKKENLGSYTLPHTIEYTVIKEPTCQEKGIALEKCLNCDYSTGEYELDIINHRFMNNWVIEIEPTCSAEGEKRDYCIYDCGQYISNIIETAPHNLVYEERVEPTCDKTGLTEGEHCSNCDFVIAEQQTIPTIPHTFTDAYDATCNACGFEREPKCAHTSKITLEAVEPTCTKPGKTAGQQCANPKCGEIIKAQQEIPAKGHSYTETVIAATCTSQGYTVYKCSCGDEYKGNYVDQKAHVYERWMLFTPPTCTSTGLRKSICENCTSVISETVSKLPHSYNSVLTKPTTTSQGYTTYTCTGCGHSYVDSYTDPLPKTSEGLEFRLSADGNGYYLSGIGDCTDTLLVIPDFYEGTPVIGIRAGAFKNCASLSGVIIPNTVETIGDEAFYNCWSLESVTFDNSHLKSIGNYAFYTCLSLKSIEIPNSVIGIGKSAFMNCHSLSNVYFSNYSQLRSISDSAFCGCSSLSHITIPSTVTYLSNSAFQHCIKLIEVCNKSALDCNISAVKHYITHESETYLQRIGDYEFYDDGTNVYLMGYHGNETEIVLPKYFNTESYSIYDEAFAYNKSLKKVTICNLVKSIGYRAFHDCTSLTSIIIPNSVLIIEQYAFLACPSLTIYCEVESKPNEWSYDWNHLNYPVIWNYKAN